MESHFGYKKAQNGYIVKLEILGKHNENRKSIVNKDTAKMRCSSARVVDIFHVSRKTPKRKTQPFRGIHDPSFIYKIGEVVKVDNYDKNKEKVCATGIHYFLTEEPAKHYYSTVKNFTGEFKDWHDNGQLWIRATYKNMKLNGQHLEWDRNGRLHAKSTHCDGVLDGNYMVWHPNGKLAIQATYKNGVLEGEYKKFSESGYLLIHKFYKNGKGTSHPV